MTNYNIFIVSSHYSEDMTWLLTQNKYDFVVYSHNENAKNILSLDDNRLRIIENKGREATSFLKFMIDFYDDLPDFIAFCHGHESAWHQSKSVLEAINDYNGEEFFTLNNQYYRNSLYEDCPLFLSCNLSKKSWEDVKVFCKSNDIEIPEKLELTMGAQFVVKKDCILRNSKEFYKKIYDWFYKQTLTEDFKAAMLIEQLWYFILTGKNIEPKLIKKTILSERGYIEL